MAEVSRDRAVGTWRAEDGDSNTLNRVSEKFD